MDLGRGGAASGSFLDSQINLILALFVLLSVIVSSDASIHVYDLDLFGEVGNAYLLPGGSEGIVASSGSGDSSVESGVDDGRSYIKFENITFWRTKEAAGEHMGNITSLVQVVIFEAADRDTIGGSAYGGQRSICCTPDLANLEGCKKGEVIKIPSATNINWPIVLNVEFNGNLLSTSMVGKEVSITKTGMYNLFFVACDPKLKGLKMSGLTVWKNPGGYLPGRIAPLLKFYVFMSLAYVLLSVIWFFQYVRFWKDLLQLQHCITTVIALGLFEMSLWYLDYAYFNNAGVRPVQITSWAVTIGAIRQTVSRLLILCVSMGYGVVKPTLGGLTAKVWLLGTTYFLASELLDITEYVGTINDISGRARIFLVVPDAFLDAFLILWIFTSLSKTLEQLQAKRSSVKLDIYRKFSNALVILVVASVAWIGYEVYFKATDPFNERWQSAWIITAFWDILAFALLSVICYLWAPSQSSQRYAYSEDKGEDSDDEEAQSLTKTTTEGDVSLVKLQKRDKKDETNETNGDFDSEDEEQQEGKRN